MRKQIALLSLIFFMVTPVICEADMGPKPSFTIFFDGLVVAGSKTELLECQEANCGDQTPFREMGPQRFKCDTEHHTCFAMAYGFPPFLKLRIHAKGKVYESDSFQPGGDFDAILKDGQIVMTRRWMSRIFCWACW